MKLDSIIYDTNTLASALTQRLQEESPTFKAIYPSETGTALVNLLAGYGSMLQYNLISAMANCYTDTAFSDAGIHQLAETLGNRLHGNVSAKIVCSITRLNATGLSGVEIPANCVFDVDGVKFFNKDKIIFPLSINTVSGITLHQGEYITVEKITSGVVGEKIYFSENFKCDMSQVKVTIDSEEWNTIETFLPLNSNNLSDISEAKTVLLRTDPDGRTYIKFGNNTNGMLPASGKKIIIQYVSNVGASGNIENNSANITLETPVYYKKPQGGNPELLTVACKPTTTSFGGYNTQDLQTLKESSPFVFASGNRAVRREDYKALLLNKCGYKSCNVWGEYEESNYYGYYSLAMMNTVYYTGVKSLQKYDNNPLGDIIFEDGIFDAAQRAKNPITFVSYMGSLKGFSGSYTVDIVYSENPNVKITYADKYGTGILTYDPSSNSNDQEMALYPYNDLQEDFNSGDVVITCKQKFNNQGIEYMIRDYDPVNNPTGFIYEGKDSEDYVMMLNYDSPLQIELNFGEGSLNQKSIAAFQFRAPSNPEHLENFIGRFAVYATENPEALTTNIKNDGNWTKILEVTEVPSSIGAGDWTDWFTTNLYQPGKTSLNKGWVKYNRYVIEIYSHTSPNADKSGGKVYIQQLKAIYSEYSKTEDQTHFVSTINYNNNGAVSMCIPGFPEEMNYYKYSVNISGLTQQVGYRTGDVVSFRYDANGSSSVYFFHVQIINIDNGIYEVTLSKNTQVGTSDLTGKDKITIEDAKLQYMTSANKYGDVAEGDEATITIESEPSVQVFGSAIGNAYDKEDVEALDQPIIDQYNHFTTYIEFRQPRVKNANITLSVEYDDSYTYITTKNKIVEAVHKIFELTPYYIGKDLNVSDIWQAVNKVKGIKRFIVDYPTTNIHCEPFEFIMLPENNLVINDILNTTFK